MDGCIVCRHRLVEQRMVLSFSGCNKNDFSFVIVHLERVSSHPRLYVKNAVLCGFHPIWQIPWKL